MTKDEIKEGLAEVAAKLEDLEAAARRLQNQNFADVAMSAKGRVQQLADHSDLDLVHKEMYGEDHSDEPLTFDPKAGKPEIPEYQFNRTR